MTATAARRTDPDAPHPRDEHLIHVIPRIPHRAEVALLILAVALGGLVRAGHTLASDFPLNDGGMFYAFAADLQRSGFRLPEVTSYNYADIPFAYSPLGFYVAAALDVLTPASLMDLFRFLPLLYSTTVIAAFALLARRILVAQPAVIGATLAFALIPRSFMWLLMGGGVARGLGLTCALLAMHEAHRLYTEGRTRSILTGGALSAATVLAHVETGWFLAFTTVVFWVAFGRTRRTFAYSVALAALGGVLTAPWWLAVASMHGLAPFIEANASGGNVLSGMSLARETFLSIARITSTSEPLFPLIGALGLLGGLLALRQRHPVLPIWWVVIILLDLRAYPTFTTIPVALMAGLAISQIVLPLAHLIWEHPLLPARIAETHPDAPWLRVSRGAALLAVGMLLYSTVGATLRAPGMAGEAVYLVGLTHDERSAMQWLRTNTPEDARILITPRGPWQVDKESEWFPVLAERQSVATVQGTEWTDFAAAVRAYDSAWQCGYQLVDCLNRWRVENERDFDYIWVPWTEHGQCCGTLVTSLRGSNAYRVVYDGAGGTIFARGREAGSFAMTLPDDRPRIAQH
jgi:hypothetical protein